jgi:hypothetical protein
MAPATNPAMDFVRFAESDFTGEDADYVAEGLRGLAGALGALNVGTPELTVDLRVAAEHVLLHPTTEATTPTVSAGLLSVARALDGSGYPGARVLSGVCAGDPVHLGTGVGLTALCARFNAATRRAVFAARQV